jgi:y4mF family transcriptional regulator
MKSVRSVGALVRDQRKQRGLSQGQLAEKVGVSRLWVGHLEKGKESVELGLVLRTLRVLELAVDVSRLESLRLDVLDPRSQRP